VEYETCCDQSTMTHPPTIWHSWRNSHIDSSYH